MLNEAAASFEERRFSFVREAPRRVATRRCDPKNRTLRRDRFSPIHTRFEVGTRFSCQLRDD